MLPVDFGYELAGNQFAACGRANVVFKFLPWLELGIRSPGRRSADIQWDPLIVVDEKVPGRAARIPNGLLLGN